MGPHSISYKKEPTSDWTKGENRGGEKVEGGGTRGRETKVVCTSTTRFGSLCYDNLGDLGSVSGKKDRKKIDLVYK